MAKVELKQPVIQEISELLDGAKSAVMADYHGLTVEQDTILRRKCREAGVTYKVYKNTMVRFAVKGTEFEGLEPLLSGPNAIAVSKDDATAAASVLYQFAKDVPALELKGGVLEGTFYDEKQIQVIATIPSREVLLGRLLGSLKSPIANFARVINQIAEKGGEGAPAEAPAETAEAEAPAETAEAPAEAAEAEAPAETPAE